MAKRIKKRLVLLRPYSSTRVEGGYYLDVYDGREVFAFSKWELSRPDALRTKRALMKGYRPLVRL